MSTLPQAPPSTFGDRLYDEVSAFDEGPDWQTFCQAFGAMFQPVADIADDDDLGNVGYSIIMDITRVPPLWFAWLAQFVGVDLQPGLTDDAQRIWIEQTNNFAIGRPASIIASVQATLTGTQTVVLRQRDGTAWRDTIITRTAETPNPAVTLAALLTQKPAFEQFTYITEDLADYAWVKANVNSYATLKANYATYEALRSQVVA